MIGETKNLKYIINDLKNNNIIITFAAFNTFYVNNHYSKYKTDNLEKLTPPEFLFYNTFSKILKYNYIFVTDKFQLWYSINYNEILLEIQEILNKFLNPKIICIGSSAGGFGSLLYGNTLKSVLTISIVPQTMRFKYFMNEYRNEMVKKFDLINIPNNNLKNIQPFNSKIFIIVGKLNDDLVQINNLDHNDKNLEIMFLDYNSHDIIDLYGKKNFIEYILKLIEITFI